MTHPWVRSLSRGSLLLGVAFTAIAVSSTLYLVLSVADLVDEALLLAVAIGVLVTTATGAVVYGYAQIDGE